MALEIVKMKDEFARRNITWLPALFIGVAILKFVYKIGKPIFLDGKLVAIGVNYIQFGAVRRGLVGSIIYLSGANLVYGTYLVYWISFLLFLWLAYLILERMTIAASSFRPFVIILAALLLFWSTDISRTDMLVAAILAAAALAAIEGNIIASSVCVAAGLAIHETVAICGLPLLLAILLDEDRYKDMNLSSAAIGGAIIVASFAANALVLPFLPHSDPKTIVETIKSEIPPNDLTEFTDQTFYMLLGGFRAVRTVQCAVQHSAHYFIHPFVAVFMIALTTFSLSRLHRREWTAPAIASVPPMLFLWLVGSDMSRWTAFSILNVWIVCAVRTRSPIDDGSSRGWAMAASAVAVLVLLYPSTVSVYAAYDVPSPLIEKFVEDILGPPNIRTFDDCDPTWRSVLTGTDE